MTTTERRLAKVEASMTPTQFVLRWLDEAQRYGDFVTYTRSLLDAGPSDFPMDRLAREADEGARTQARGKPREEAEAAIRRAVVETIFRVQLVLRINVVSQELLDREGLIQAALSAHLGLIVDRCHPEEEPDRLRRLAQNRDLLLGRVTELHAYETARTKVEARYLDGQAADFPAARREWAEQRSRSETMALIALRIAELDGAAPAPPDDPLAFDTRVAAQVSDLVEPARSKAYDELGDGRRALTVAVRWLRPKLLGDQAIAVEIGAVRDNYVTPTPLGGRAASAFESIREKAPTPGAVRSLSLAKRARPETVPRSELDQSLGGWAVRPNSAEWLISGQLA